MSSSEKLPKEAGSQRSCVVQDFEFEWVHEEDGGKTWYCYLKPNRQLSHTFDLVREILLSVAEYEEFQARTIHRAHNIIKGARPRLSEDFSIVIAKSSETAKHVEEFGGSFDTSFVGFSFAEIMFYLPHGHNSVVLASAQLRVERIRSVRVQRTDPDLAEEWRDVVADVAPVERQRAGSAVELIEVALQ